MTVSILDALATLPSGAQGASLTTDELAIYLRNNYNTQNERERNARHVLRDDLYRDGGCSWMAEQIDQIFQDQTVRELRKKWVKHARFNNALKRVVNELSTVYAAPATRVVDATANDAYQQLLSAVRFDEQMLETSRLYNLHRALLVGFRVRMKPDGTREPVMDIATPAIVRVVTHPNDSTLPIGWLIRVSHKSARGLDRPAAWALWTDHERALLDEQMSVIPDSWKEHGFGVCPWVPLMRFPVPPGIWPGEEGEDLVAAQVSIWFANILMMKETKSATRQTIAQGDVSTMGRGQPLDTESMAQVPDGVTMTSVDMSMDLALFRDTSDHVLENVGANYGMSIAQLKHQGVQSAEARELMRAPLRELRMQQQVHFRLFERRFAEVMSAVTAKELPALTFALDGWRVDFADAQTPLTPTEQLAIFEKARTMGLDNTVDYLMRLNPDLTPEQARDVVLRNIEVETWRNEQMRPLQAISGAMGAEMSAPGQGEGGPASAGFMVGDRVRVVGTPHMPGQDEGVIAEVDGNAYGIRFDGMAGIHRWYVADELEAVERPESRPATMPTGGQHG